MNRHFSRFCAIVGLALIFAGCGTAPVQKFDPSANKWFLDPSVEFANYKTYGFAQVTAVRYQDPINYKPKHRSFFQYLIGASVKEEKRPEIHHTDELIWRVLADEMAAKGYSQVAPQKADLWVIYYGGPRPIQPMGQLRIKPHAFDAYFAANEMTPDMFFVDVIDAKEGTLIYRGWDNTTFKKNTSPDADRVVHSAEQTIGFFPSKK